VSQITLGQITAASVVSIAIFGNIANATVTTQPALSESGAFNFAEASSPNPVGLGQPIFSINVPGNTLKYFSGGTFDDVGIDATPTCIIGSAICSQLNHAAPLGSTLTTVSAVLLNSSNTPIPYAFTNAQGQLINKSAGQSITIGYTNSQAFPTEYSADLSAALNANGIPPGSHWALTVTNTAASNSPLPPVNTPVLPSLLPQTSSNSVTGIVLNSGLSPVISWTPPSNPPAGSVIEIQVQDLTSSTKGTAASQQSFVNLNIGLASTTSSFSFSPINSGNNPTCNSTPCFSFLPNDYYSIGVEVKSPGATTSRSDTWTAPFKASTSGPPIALPTITPSNTPSGFSYSFDVPVTTGQPINIDPLIAIGFVYQIGVGDPDFASVVLPNLQGSEAYTVTWDGGAEIEQLLGGNLLNFLLTDPNGVSNFTVTGIDPSLILDPLNSTDFVTTLTFAGSGTFTGTMTPITEEVPEPDTLALLAGGLIGLLALQRRRNHKMGRPGKLAV
jgi:hypothetical protein